MLDVTSPHYRDAVAGAPSLTPHREVGPHDPFMMIFTSGTSGNPKAVPFAHGMSVMCGASLIAQLDITADDVCYLAMPLFHSNGVAAGLVGGDRQRRGDGPGQVHGVGLPVATSAATGATYMNYVGKPLALVLATPEQPDDADNTLRAAFGNEATDRDIAEFTTAIRLPSARRVRLERVRGDHLPRRRHAARLDRQGLPGVAIYHSGYRDRVCASDFSTRPARWPTSTRRSASW